MTNNEIAEELAKLVAEGGRIAMTFHGASPLVTLKGDDSPLTAADLAVDAYLCRELEARFPDIPVVTEERSATHDAAKAGRRFFLVDPIDGTKEFVAERGEFTVNIGLIEDGIPVAGAVCAPAVGRLFYGVSGRGGFETAMDGSARKPLALRPYDNNALIAVATRSHPTPQTEAFLNANRIAHCTNAGSSLKFCLLASGEADIYPRFGPTMEWDTAAGHAVLLAAGGKVVEISGVDLKYGKPAFRNPNFIAYTPGVTFTVPTL